MTTIHARQALLSTGWAADVRLMLSSGQIQDVELGVEPQAGDEQHAILLPSMPNVHSHAFQRGMAGLAEVRGPGSDSFWSWREVMYRFALTMTAEDVEAVAAQLYVEMLEAGFGRVGEFHYLHHQPDGQPYADIGELAARIAAAASQTGIALTLLPVFYAHSGFGGAAPNGGQRRFINDRDQFAALLERCETLTDALPNGVTGLAPHSLRAVTPDELDWLAGLRPDKPIHIHIAEQVKEVEDCVAWSGRRPVEWLLGHQPVDARWCLIHATHMTSAETTAFAKTGAVAGLCPITEANLGDGIFEGVTFAENGGAIAIGSDSNIEIGVGAELRSMEYAQRLHHRGRNMLVEPGRSNGAALFNRALVGGAQALGVSSGLSRGAAADFVSLQPDDVALAGRSGDAILDAWIFSGRPLVDCVWVNGTKQVEAGRHRRREAIARRFTRTVERLLS
ncbi:formimidoylglutamate deiminase [Tianweitania sediminis]|uniref:Formimidoylglutamate deiminase n=1 Tax=Tianweitania sediminis TaxID=1502156 RepID=A0A8J7R035_9HYPH|nr:formimidoylglutamate deiminase [Tianweitania sediminis]MBP0437416.1 formimidoylglutamate deiminase [Tianweitania sediminis]